jgi:anti-sigma regulatory factor (Ser/Thr protein kinase)
VSAPFKLQFDGNAEAAAGAYPRLIAALDAANLDAPCRYGVELVFDEVVTNIVHYGSPEGRSLAIDVTVAVHDDAVEMTFEDDGIAFDSSVPTTAPVGGFGLILVRKAVTELRYGRTPEGRNRLVAIVPRTAA